MKKVILSLMVVFASTQVFALSIKESNKCHFSNVSAKNKFITAKMGLAKTKETGDIVTRKVVSVVSRTFVESSVSCADLESKMINFVNSLVVPGELVTKK